MKTELTITVTVSKFMKQSINNSLKTHLRYKTMISQNVPSEAQVKKYFV